MSSDPSITRLVIQGAVTTVFTYLAFKYLANMIDPDHKKKMKAKEKAKLLMAQLGIPKNISLDEHEMMIASNLIHADSLQISWDHIAGLDSLIQELRETVIWPIRNRGLFNSELTQAPKGVLLHGPPGCGKTMIAKATAKESGARFLCLDASVLQDKWYGESQKLTSAVFSLAQKIQPCIVFIDEIDSLLRARNFSDHEATSSVKAQFMQLWDGMATDPSCTVVIMGATNRPKDLDAAILRRMPSTFHVGLPNVNQRKSILKTVLKIENTDVNVDYNRLANLSEGFSGSDLRELCRAAAVFRVRDFMKTHSGCEDDNLTLRPITNDDLLQGLAKMKESKVHCGQATFTLD